MQIGEVFLSIANLNVHGFICCALCELEPGNGATFMIVHCMGVEGQECNRAEASQCRPWIKKNSTDLVVPL